jgi:hypothetical protein
MTDWGSPASIAEPRLIFYCERSYQLRRFHSWSSLLTHWLSGRANVAAEGTASWSVITSAFHLKFISWLKNCSWVESLCCQLIDCSLGLHCSVSHWSPPNCSTIAESDHLRISTVFSLLSHLYAFLQIQNCYSDLCVGCQELTCYSAHDFWSINLDSISSV